MSYRDPVQSACPPLHTTSTGDTTILRRSLRKIIEESKKDATSSSVSNSRESTPPRISSSGRWISSRKAFSAGSSSLPASLSKKSGERTVARSSRGVASAETSRATKQLDFPRRSTRSRRVKRSVDDGRPMKSLPFGHSVMSSDDETNSVNGSSKVSNSISDLDLITKSTLLDTSDTDSRASSLCAYSIRSAASSRITAAKSVSRRSTAAAKPKTGQRLQILKCARDDQSKLQSSDSEIESQSSVLRTPFLDSFLDCSSNGSSVCSSVPAAELPSDHRANGGNFDVSSSLETNETCEIKSDLKKSDLEKGFGLDASAKAQSRSESTSPLCDTIENVSADLQEIRPCLENEVKSQIHEENDEISESDDRVSDIQTREDPLITEHTLDSSAIEDHATGTKEEKAASIRSSRDEDLNAAEENKERLEVDDADQTEDAAAKSDDRSKMVISDGGEAQGADDKLKEEVDDMADVKEEPPEILVTHVCLL